MAARLASGLAAASSKHDESINIDDLEVEYSLMLKNLRKVFATKKTYSSKWRLSQIDAMRRAVVEMQDEIDAALYEDLKRPPAECFTLECLPILGEIDHVRENLINWMKPKSVSHPLILEPGWSMIKPQPLGVTFILSPWNYPIQLVLLSMLAAISAGNCMIVKPSEVSPASAKLVEKIVSKYLDTDCIKIVQGAVSETTALLRLKYDSIIFTGSSHIGRIVSKAAAVHLTPVLLELGGKSGAFVHKSCRIQTAAKRLLLGKFSNNGQTCIGVDFVMLDKSIEHEFLDELVKQVELFYGKNPKESGCFGRIVNERHWSRIMRLLKDHKGKVLCGGPENADGNEKYIPPTIVLNPDPDSELMTEEIFGPVLPIIVVDSMEQGVSFVNEREHPLASYIFAEDQKTIDYITENTIAGGMTINDCLTHIVNPELPFGGVGESGMQAYHGKHGFDHQSHLKPIMYRSTLIDLFFRYPPYDNYPAILDVFKMYVQNAHKIKRGAKYAAVILLLAIISFYIKK